MKCPHCSVEIHPGFVKTRIYGSDDYWQPVAGLLWTAGSMTCPSCARAIITLAGEKHETESRQVAEFLAYPRHTGRPKAASEVPPHIAEDYHEASAVLASSAKASAALSRRCLQAVLRENGFAQRDLAPAIQAVIDSRTLPTALAENIDAIRNIGNFAAHPLKDTSTNEILPVEPHEAEWNLEVLESLFDFFYVQPAKARARRAALDAKLAAAGKPPMKS